MSAFREEVGRDIEEVFLDLDDFADVHDVEGAPVKCVLSTDRGDAPTDAKAPGLSEYNAVLYAKEEDLPARRPAGATLVVDGMARHVVSWSSEMGMAHVVLREAEEY
jgi:hypothetical protein